MNKSTDSKHYLSAAEHRRQEAYSRRIEMAKLAARRPVVTVPSNGEDDKMTSQPMNFTKGLPHDAYGLAARADYLSFREALVEPKYDFPVETAPQSQRRWESPLAGHYFTGLGPDPDAVAMAPAPRLGSSELCAEMAMVYAMALTRDIPFADLQNPTTEIGFALPAGHPNAGAPATVQHLVDELCKLSWINPNGSPTWFFGDAPTELEQRRREANWDENRTFSVKSLFRGSTEGAKRGPIVSQFMLIGTKSRQDETRTPEDGYIEDGAQSIDQRVDLAAEGLDFMRSWTDWLAIQRGARPATEAEDFVGTRFIKTPRDMATYVHFDQLYQAYLSACLILLGNSPKLDPGFPIDRDRGVNSEGFATFGGPHILSIMPEVASRALRAARRQKFQVHRRARPEVLAARLTQVANNAAGSMDQMAKAKLHAMLKEMGHGSKYHPQKPAMLLTWIAEMNAAEDHTIECDTITAGYTYLLPMAFREGSPMHAAYGAGHATVAGACVTILKAFFDPDWKLSEGTSMDGFVVPDAEGNLIPAEDQAGFAQTTVAQELDKLAANISIGRNMAGVHYYTDYYDSLRMGERVAIGMLEEQLLAYTECVSMSLTGFDGEKITISTNGDGRVSGVTVIIEDKDGTPVPYEEWWVRNIAEFGEEVNSSLV